MLGAPHALALHYSIYLRSSYTSDIKPLESKFDHHVSPFPLPLKIPSTNKTILYCMPTLPGTEQWLSQVMLLPLGHLGCNEMRDNTHD
jgi:hypothetical protein